MSERMKQINELMRKEIGNFMARELEMPRDTMITITRIDTAPNLRHARVYFSVLPDNKRGTALRFLKNNKTGVQRFLSKHLKIRYQPSVQFMLDEQAIYGNEIDRLLDSL